MKGNKICVANTWSVYGSILIAFRIKFISEKLDTSGILATAAGLIVNRGNSVTSPRGNSALFVYFP